jgi:hypothetical protein
MKSADVLKWFDQLGAVKLEAVLSRFGLNAEGTKWVADAASAIAAAFPPGHEIRRRWDALAMLTEDRKDTKHPIELQRLEGYKGIFASAHEQLREGRLDSFIDTVRAQAEDDLLEQAEALRDDGLLVAATVLAGGALEVHLRQLCAKNALAVQGHGSIDKYNTAIGVARNCGLTIYEKPDSSSVTSWGQLRNDAAHKPDQFRTTSDQVKLMIDGVRNFIGRVR